MGKTFNVLKNKEQLVNQTVSVGGGDYTPPEEGMAKGRLVAYVEVGKHEKTYKGVKSLKPMVHLTFELSGKKWEPKKLDDGTLVPQRITIKENLSTSAKARYYALFLKMRNEREDITHMAEMLGEAFLLRIHHRKYKVTVDGKEVERIAAECQKDKAWTIQPPVMEIPKMEDDGEGNMVPTGEFDRKPVTVADPISDLRLFIWDLADKEQWDSLYIEPGDGDKSRNVFQELIVKAANFTGSVAEAAASGSASLEAILKGGKGSAESASDDTGEDGSEEGTEDDAASKKAAAAASKVNKGKKPPAAETPADPDDLSDIN